MQTFRNRIFVFSAFILCSSLFILIPPLADADNDVPQKSCTCPCPCPAPEVEEPSSDSDKCPEEMLINTLVKAGGKDAIYGPVDFTHRDHADYADDGCTQCHHHAPPGVYQPCKACHPVKKKLFKKKTEEMLMPGLKASYHRQCMGCHLEMDAGPLECTECHALKKK